VPAKPKAPQIITPKYGLIVWWENCPPLDDIYEKRRPVIVVNPFAPPGDVAIVVCTSCTAGPSEPDSIRLPNKSDQPQCRTGLPKPCCAIPRWFLPINHETLKRCDFCGTLGGDALHKLLEAYLSRQQK
jgi:hypothetical protein